MDQDNMNQKMHQILARCWTDAAFKAQLLADPVAVLTAQGFDLPEGLQIRVLEDSPELMHWGIPTRPSELSDAALDAVAGGQFEGLIPAMPSLTSPGVPGLPPIRDRLENLVAAEVRKQNAQLLSSLRRIS